MEQVHFHKMIPKYFWQKFTMFLFQRVMIGIVQCNAMFFLFSLEQSCAPWISIVFSTSFDFFFKGCVTIFQIQGLREWIFNSQLWAFRIIWLLFFKICPYINSSHFFQNYYSLFQKQVIFLRFRFSFDLKQHSRGPWN